jgi:hypothetical protein
VVEFSRLSNKPAKKSPAGKMHNRVKLSLSDVFLFDAS